MNYEYLVDTYNISYTPISLGAGTLYKALWDSAYPSIWARLTIL